jgi:site-specific DNA-methyltransferase (cytosine-N4-specific)
VRESTQRDKVRPDKATYLSRLHPYPAMVADELARSLVARYVPKNAKVLDPFCGSGRLLAAAEDASLRVGVDANPLACLLTRAKFAKSDRRKIERIIAGLKQAQAVTQKTGNTIQTGRKVAWFSRGVAQELSRIVLWLNGLGLAESEKVLVASALSATVREVSFARAQGWKLHRLSAEARSLFKPCPWERFERRLKYCLKEMSSDVAAGRGRVLIELANAKSFGAKGRIASSEGLFDIVLTSPPYGDSQSTVQYGAASSLCLAVISGLDGFSHLAVSGRSIDNACLGGSARDSVPPLNMKKYWAGSSENRFGRALSKFLLDYDEVCGSVARQLKVGGKAIFVVGRRSTGGYRLKLDKFTIDCLQKRGFDLVCTEERELQQKRTPRVINRFARDRARRSEASARVLTMNSEIVVVMKKTAGAKVA